MVPDYCANDHTIAQSTYRFASRADAFREHQSRQNKLRNRRHTSLGSGRYRLWRPRVPAL
jgi:hypothetical protein